MSESNSELFRMSADLRAFSDAFVKAITPAWKQALADEIARHFDTRSEIILPERAPERRTP